MEKEYDLAGKGIGLAMEVHRFLGPGFVESVYENAVAVELRASNLEFELQKALKVNYKGKYVGEFLADILIENSLVVELKSVRRSFEFWQCQPPI